LGIGVEIGNEAKVTLLLGISRDDMLAASAGTFPVCGFLTARPHPVHFVHPV
jgi:hypothetical protein